MAPPTVRSDYRDRLLGRQLEQDFIQAFRDSPPEPDMDPEEAKRMAAIAWETGSWVFSGQRWKERENTVRNWVIEREQEEQRIRQALPPRDIVCRSCGSLMEAACRVMHEGKVVFGFKCPRECAGRAHFEDGQEWETAITCPRCEGKTIASSRDKSAPGIVIRYACPGCSHQWIDLGCLSA